MEYEQIKFNIENHTATITLNRPDAFNAFSDVMRNELRAAIDTINTDSSVRVVVLTGEGKAFCSGGDVKLMVSRMESGLSYDERREIFRKDVAQMVLKFKSIRQPLIAAINGGTYGAGCSLALLCDIRIASDKAKFGFLFGKRGLIPDWGSNYTLPRLIGLSRAMELVSTGEIIDAETALRYGLVNQVTAHESLLATVNEMCSKIVANSPFAVVESKAALTLGLSQSLQDALEYEASMQSICQLSKDHAEGVLSFVEKREPVFKD